MSQRVQQDVEDILKYVREKERLCVKLKLSVSDTIREIIQTPHSTKMSYSLRDKEYGTVNDLLRAIRGYKAFRKARESQFPASTTRRTSTPAKTTGTAGTMVKTSSNDSAPSTSKKGNDQSKTKCYNCQGYGHYASACPEPKRPQRCSKCNQEGHRSRNCTSQTAPKTVMRATENERCKMIYKNAIVCGREVIAVLDTGADISLTKLSFAAKLNKQLIAQPGAPIRGVGGSQTSLGEIIADLCVDNIDIAEVRFFVVEDSCLPGPDVIVGTDVIDSPNLVLIRDGGVSLLINKTQSPEFERVLEDLTIRRGTICAQESVEIPPLTVQFVSAVSTGHTEEQLIPVTNHGHSTLALKAGQVLSRKPEVEEVSPHADVCIVNEGAHN
ncbi:uncharacterized protein LOC135373326 [Ornithodoros turicata]|uniref:uncharacterized protein LOC135373326 n=1 Tax=Ornithodoros turicata TaxID=34597 RepID=UPI003139D136